LQLRAKEAASPLPKSPYSSLMQAATAWQTRSILYRAMKTLLSGARAKSRLYFRLRQSALTKMQAQVLEVRATKSDAFESWLMNQNCLKREPSALPILGLLALRVWRFRSPAP